jgi:hypothetical protein
MFCGSSELTSTHLIGLKLQEALPKSAQSVAVDAYWEGPNGREDHSHRYHSPPLDVQVRRACHDCNGTWMNGFENRTRDLVTRLAYGQDTVFDRAAAADLAVWATIVAMLRATRDRGPWNFSEADIRFIRERDEVPPGHLVFLVWGTPARWDLASRHSRFGLTYEGDDTVQPSQLTWFWLGEAIFVVMKQALLRPLMDRGALTERNAVILWSGIDEMEAHRWPTLDSVQHADFVERTTLASPEHTGPANRIVILSD